MKGMERKRDTKSTRAKVKIKRTRLSGRNVKEEIHERSVK